MPRSALLRSALIWTAAIALIAVGCPSPQERAERARSEAEEALSRGDLPAVRDALEALREHGTDTLESLLELTNLMLRAGEAPEAVWLLEAALSRHPDHDALRTQLARAALIVGNPVLARSTLEPVPPDAPEHLDARLLAAQAELELGDLDAALEILERAAAVHPDRPEAAAVRVATLLREGRSEEATAVLERARAGASDARTARSLELLAARVELARGDPAAAIRLLGILWERHPDDGLVLQTLVRALLQADRSDEALARVQAALAREPDAKGLPAILAQVHLQRGEIEQAEAAIREFARRSDSPSALVLLAQFHARRGDVERAAGFFAEGVLRFPRDAMLRMHLAESLIERDRPGEASEQLEVFRSLAPGDPHGEYLEARLVLARGDALRAASVLRKLVSRLDRAYTQFWLGRSLLASGDAVGAERRYGLALLRDPTHTASASALVRLAEKRGDWGAVARYAMALMQRDPTAPQGYTTAVTALVRSGQLTRAENVARRAALLFPDRVDTIASQALVLRAQGRLDEAESLLARGERELGAAPELAEERAFVFATKGDLASGVATLRAALVESPERARLQAALAALELGRGNAAAGAAAVDRALALDPEDPAPLALRASFYAAQRRYEDAKRDCERFLEIRPRDAGMRFVLGVVAEGLGETDAAIAHYQRASELDERAYAPRNNLAVLLAAGGELADAMAVAQEAYALADSDPNVIDTLGWLYLKAGLTDRAVALLERAHGAAPQQSAPQLHLALAYREAGRPEDAHRLLVDLESRVEPGSPLASQTDAALRSLDE